VTDRKVGLSAQVRRDFGEDIAENRIERWHRLSLGFLRRSHHFGRRFCFDGGGIRLGQLAFRKHVSTETLERATCFPSFKLFRVDVLAWIIRSGVTAHAESHSFDQGRAFAGACTLDGIGNHTIDSQHIVAIHKPRP